MWEISNVLKSGPRISQKAKKLQKLLKIRIRKIKTNFWNFANYFWMNLLDEFEFSGLPFSKIYFQNIRFLTKIKKFDGFFLTMTCALISPNKALKSTRFDKIQGHLRQRWPCLEAQLKLKEHHLCFLLYFYTKKGNLLTVHALWYQRVWSQRIGTQLLGQVRVPSIHFWKIKGQKVKLKGNQYSTFGCPKGFISVT